VLETDSGRDPAAIEKEVKKELRKRLALVDTATGPSPRQPGAPVTPGDVNAWIRASDGVRRIVQLELRGADGKSIKEVAVLHSGLPRWNQGSSAIEARRPETGRSR
jgi:hypothetical protein